MRAERLRFTVSFFLARAVSGVVAATEVMDKFDVEFQIIV
jgi:hypothetical protein